MSVFVISLLGVGCFLCGAAFTLACISLSEHRKEKKAKKEAAQINKIKEILKDIKGE